MATQKDRIDAMETQLSGIAGLLEKLTAQTASSDTEEKPTKGRKSRKSETAAKVEAVTTNVTTFDLPDGGKVEVYGVTHSAGSKDGSSKPVQYKTPRVMVKQTVSGQEGRTKAVALTPAVIAFLRSPDFAEWAAEDELVAPDLIAREALGEDYDVE